MNRCHTETIKKTPRHSAVRFRLLPVARSDFRKVQRSAREIRRNLTQFVHEIRTKMAKSRGLELKDGRGS